jgi:competence protein ComEA
MRYGRLSVVRFATCAILLVGTTALLPAAGEARQEHKPSSTPAAVLDINQATAEDFTTLPGIGPKLARRIVAFREKHGPFRRIEDLMAIKGLGLKKWKAIRPYMEVRSQKTGVRTQKAKGKAER